MAHKAKGSEVPTFQEFTSAWLENREPELRPKTIASYRWQLHTHLLPRFARLRVDEIGPQEVDRYKAGKLREGALGPNQINKSLGLLAMILDAATDYGHSSCPPCSRPPDIFARSWRRWLGLG